jgi:hypothetical protein
MEKRYFWIILIIISGSFIGLYAGNPQVKQTETTKRNENSLQQRSGKKYLNAFYYRAQMYTMVPHQIKEDMKWLADAGTNAITISVLEQDFEASFENIQFIIKEANKLGMDVFAAPSRWGGIVAGSPKVPSVFTCRNPQTWVLHKDGTAVDTSISGRISSINSEETYQFVENLLDELFQKWNFKGVIWDEPKTISMDYSQAAIQKFGVNPTMDQQIQANVDFYSRLNKHVKTKFPDKTTSLFVYSSYGDETIKKLAKIECLDYFGADGRPWDLADGGQLEGDGKTLLGIQGQRFIDAAHANSKKSLFLMENHNLPKSDIHLLEKGMPELLKMDVDQLIYYYYPRNVEDPDKTMNIIKKYLRNYR